jgi:hypothetical protein
MGFSFTWDSDNILYTSLFFICRFWICFFQFWHTFLELLGRENKSPHNFREIRKQVIWGNKYIKYKGKCLVKVNWIKSGITLEILIIFYTPLCFLFVDFGSAFFNFDILFWNYLSFYLILCYQSFFPQTHSLY